MNWRLLVLSLCAGCGAVEPLTLGRLRDAAAPESDAATPDDSVSSDEEQEGDDDLEPDGEND